MLTIIIGLPNAGKTTYANRFKEVLHYDDIMRLDTKTRYDMYAKASVIEGIYLTRRSRRIVLNCWRKRLGKRVCVWVDTPLDVCLEREREGRNRSETVVLHNAKLFQPPTLDEGWDEIIIVKPDGSETRITKEET